MFGVTDDPEVGVLLVELLPPGSETPVNKLSITDADGKNVNIFESYELVYEDCKRSGALMVDVRVVPADQRKGDVARSPSSSPVQLEVPLLEGGDLVGDAVAHGGQDGASIR